VRELADAERVRRFMRAFGGAASRSGICYLAGGSTAVLLVWRRTTVAVDIALEPEQDDALRALPGIKDELAINVELVSPADFMPLPEGWRDRSPFVAQEGLLVFRSFDLLSQALEKLERAHARDLGDVQAMLDAGLVERDELLRAYDAIEGELWRFPAIDPGAFRSRVAEYSALDG
jgi:hypothetical protein